MDTDCKYRGIAGDKKLDGEADSSGIPYDQGILGLLAKCPKPAGDALIEAHI